jgi:hypothetical protein
VINAGRVGPQSRRNRRGLSASSSVLFTSRAKSVCHHPTWNRALIDPGYFMRLAKEVRMITTRYLGAAGVAVVMMGVAAGYASSGSAEPDPAYTMTVDASEAAARTVRGQIRRAPDQPVAIDAPASRTADGSN